MVLVWRIMDNSPNFRHQASPLYDMFMLSSYRVHYTLTVTPVACVLILPTAVQDGNHLVSSMYVMNVYVHVFIICVYIVTDTCLWSPVPLTICILYDKSQPAKSGHSYTI